MSDACADPGYGIETHDNEKFLLGRMTDHNRVDMPVVSAAIPARTMLKVGGDGKTLEPVTANADTVFGVLHCDKDVGQTRTSVFTQVDVNRDLVLPQGLDFDMLVANNSRIFFKKLIRSGVA